MLVLSRRKGQALKIGDDIVVTILELVGARVRFGVDAPRNMAVVRGKDPVEQIVTVGRDVSVKVVQVLGDRVRVGVLVPRNTSVHRLEVFEQIRIAAALAQKFSEAFEPFYKEICQINDIDLLKRISDSIESAATLDDVRRIWSG